MADSKRIGPQTKLGRDHEQVRKMPRSTRRRHRARLQLRRRLGYRQGSDREIATALRVASARSQVGETADACAALSQSLESYRKALAQETGDNEPAASSINDDSDGMADVRTRFGCKR
jgi:hypothetical protein